MSSRSANKTQLHLTRLSISLSRYSSSHGLLHRWFVIILIWGVYLTSLSSSRISARLSSLSPSSSAPNFPPKRTMTHARVYYHQRRLIYLSAKCDGVWHFFRWIFSYTWAPLPLLHGGGVVWVHRWRPQVNCTGIDGASIRLLSHTQPGGEAADTTDGDNIEWRSKLRRGTNKTILHYLISVVPRKSLYSTTVPTTTSWLILRTVYWIRDGTLHIRKRLDC